MVGSLVEKIPRPAENVGWDVVPPAIANSLPRILALVNSVTPAESSLNAIVLMTPALPNVDEGVRGAWRVKLADKYAGPKPKSTGAPLGL